ncbi:MAG: NAD+ synthase [Gammaproteobacteria bacterium]|nr:NAD+ synthase [Gammaproteobacteria bacterium]
MPRIALAQLNFLVGDISGNTERIIAAIADARDNGADLVAFPELAVTGYPPEDLLLRPGFQRRVDAAMAHIALAARGITVVVGHPLREDGRLYNALSWMENGACTAIYRKQILPNYEVFDEKRYFEPGPGPVVIEWAGLRVALTICEDIWNARTAPQARDAGANIILNINGSPYHLSKRAMRIATLHSAAVASGLPILYCNLLGGQDELVFDGGSLAVSANGEIVASAPEFAETLMMLEVTAAAGSDAPVIRGDRIAPLHQEAAAYAALVLGVRDYVHKNGFHGAVLGLSGGIDSALTLAIAADALGAENVRAISMPSVYTADMSIDDAREQCATLGCQFDIVPINPVVEAFGTALNPLLADSKPDATEENIQARTRGVMLMAVSNKTGCIVLATGNKSEMSVGYATLYGDMAGGFAPLKDVPKTLVYRLADYVNRNHEIIPQRVISRPPTAELRPDQKDTDSLPPYDVLDPILELYIEQDKTPNEICSAGYQRDDVYRVTRMVDRNEYKRRQAAPGVKISRRAFGRDRRYPITSKYSETVD